jgi:hypothetical protein
MYLVQNLDQIYSLLLTNFLFIVCHCILRDQQYISLYLTHVFITRTILNAINLSYFSLNLSHNLKSQQNLTMKLMQNFKATKPPSISKRRGRQRKQRRKQNETVTVESKKISKPVALIGRCILKEFSKSFVRIGKVVSYRIICYRVEYEEGVYEDLDNSAILSNRISPLSKS